MLLGLVWIDRRRVVYSLWVIGTAALLSAFWVLPFLATGFGVFLMRQACLTLPLHGQGPAAPAYPVPHVKRKSLISRQSQKSLRLRLDR